MDEFLGRAMMRSDCSDTQARVDDYSFVERIARVYLQFVVHRTRADSKESEHECLICWRVGEYNDKTIGIIPHVDLSAG